MDEECRSQLRCFGVAPVGFIWYGRQMIERDTTVRDGVRLYRAIRDIGVIAVIGGIIAGGATFVEANIVALNKHDLSTAAQHDIPPPLVLEWNEEKRLAAEREKNFGIAAVSAFVGGLAIATLGNGAAEERLRHRRALETQAHLSAGQN